MQLEFVKLLMLWSYRYFRW